jgi:hypothetical protein
MNPVAKYELFLHSIGLQFEATLQLTFQNNARIDYPIASAADFTAIAALLQVPGQLFFLPATQLQPKAQLVKAG